MFFNDKIDSFVGKFSLNPREKHLIRKLENDIEELKSDRDVKRDLLRLLAEQEENSRAQYEAQLESTNLSGEHLHAEVEGMRQTSRALEGYLRIMNTEEFPLYKLKIENDAYIKDVHSRIGVLVKRARDVKARVDALKLTNEKCQELQKKTQSHMQKDN